MPELIQMMPIAKLTPRLLECLDCARFDEFIYVVVELQPAPSIRSNGAANERTANIRDAFERRSRPVETAIHGAGGEVLYRAWISYTLQAKVRAGLVSRIAELDEVALMDLPRPLRPEAATAGAPS